MNAYWAGREARASCGSGPGRRTLRPSDIIEIQILSHHQGPEGGGGAAIRLMCLF